MCKHVAAVLYGVGARLDHEPEMLFTLRGVQPAELIAAAMTDAPTTRQSGRRRLLQTDDVSSVFGIELNAGDGSDGDTAPRRAPDLNQPLTNETPLRSRRPQQRRPRPAGRPHTTSRLRGPRRPRRAHPPHRRTRSPRRGGQRPPPRRRPAARTGPRPARGCRRTGRLGAGSRTEAFSAEAMAASKARLERLRDSLTDRPSRSPA